MSTRENVAIDRRVEELESDVLGTELVLIRTTLVICERGPEPRMRTVADVLGEAVNDPEPVIVERRPDLELLLHPPTATRLLRHTLTDPEDLAEWAELAAGARLIDVEITCHAKQLAAITSAAPLTAVFGGNRSGKSYSLGWWLFRRWMLRGCYGGLFWWVAPDEVRAREYGVYLLSGPEGLGGGLWPDAVFSSLSRVGKGTRSPERTLLDGSRVVFHHAHHSGRAAGKNLRSANVLDAAVDELTAILDQTNYQQIHARVSQSGGRICTATTRVSGHWSEDEIEDLETQAAGAIWSTSIDILENPWMTYARAWKLFLTDGTLDARKLEREVLPAEDPAARCRQVVNRPASLREHFGIKTADGILLWSEWTGEQVLDDDLLERDHVEHGGRRLPNITAAILSRKWSGEPSARLLGQDYNVSPMVGVAVQIFGDYAHPRTWVAVAYDEVAVDGTVQRYAKALAARGYQGAPIYCDPTGAMSGHEARGSAGSTDALTLKREGWRVKPANGSGASGVSHLSFEDSAGILHSLMSEGRLFVHVRCEGLLDALKHDRAKTDGSRDKVSGRGSVSDKRSAFTDALRYGCWPIFKSELTPKTQIKT